MTLEPSMLAVEQRLQRLASEMPPPDVEAGWAALSAMLEPPLAPVIPLRRRSFGRPIALAAAAALLVAGSAFAAVTRGDPQTHHLSPLVPIELPGVAFSGPHLHAPLSGPPAVPTKDEPGRSAKDTNVGAPTAGGTSDGGSTTTDGSGATSDHTKAQDDPNDLDQGTGNDGQHNDHGGGNNGTEDSQARGQGNGQDL
jgi:hypothetical protein